MPDSSENNVDIILKKEEIGILNNINDKDYVVALDIHGEQLSSI